MIIDRQQFDHDFKQAERILASIEYQLCVIKILAGQISVTLVAIAIFLLEPKSTLLVKALILASLSIGISAFISNAKD